MTASLIISLRETFEATLLIGVMCAVLNRSGYRKYSSVVWMGALSAVMVSIALAFVLTRYTAGLSGRAEEIYEGTLMLAATGLITWMVVWLVLEGKNLKQSIEMKVQTHLEKGQILGLFFLAFFTVLREGVEMVIFLQAVFLKSEQTLTQYGVAVGMSVALIGTYLLYLGLIRWFPLSLFLRLTALFLVLFASSLLSHSAHEFMEAFHTKLPMLELLLPMLYLGVVSFWWMKFGRVRTR